MAQVRHRCGPGLTRTILKVCVVVVAMEAAGAEAKDSWTKE